MRRKPPWIRSLRRAFAKAAFAVRLVKYDLAIGAREGLVAIGPGIRFGTDVQLLLGDRVFLGCNGVFQGTGTVTIGAGTYVGNTCSFNARSSITVGENCMLANFVSLVDNNHGIDTERDMKDQTITSAPIVIGRNCWLGEKATVLSGVTIGDGAVVAAGAVVTADVESGAIVGGVPARLIRSRTDPARS